MVEKILGSWVQKSVENFDPFMEALGVGYIMRNLASIATPQLTFSKEGDIWTLAYKIAYKFGQLKFELGQTIDEHTPDGRNVKTTFSTKDDTFIQSQTGPPKPVVVERIVKEDGLMYEVAQIENIECKRIYTRLSS